MSNLSRMFPVAAVAALLAVMWGLFASSALAQPVNLPQLLAVDRAGNTLVTVRGRDLRRETALLLDTSGQLAHCRTGAPATAAMAARARRDADGFLFTSEDGSGRSSLERWDARGGVDWEQVFELRPGFNRRPGLASTPDGGAALIEEFDVPGYLYEAQMVRLGADGTERWRTPLFAYGNGLSEYDLSVDRHGRLHFAASATRSPFSLNAPGTVRLGMVGADGRLAWLHAEAHGSAAQSKLFSDGNGDFWWYLSAHGWPSVPYRPSQLARWTPWGMPLATFEGPAMVAGSEIHQPAVDGSEAVWFLAFGPRELELVRVGTAGREARHVIDARREPRSAREGAYYWTLLSVAADAAWVAVLRPAIDGGPTVERYTRAGRAWSRRLPGQVSVQTLVATETGEARVLSENAGREPWLVSLSPRSGEERWRVSLSAAFAACQSP